MFRELPRLRVELVQGIKVKRPASADLLVRLLLQFRKLRLLRVGEFAFKLLENQINALVVLLTPDRFCVFWLLCGRRYSQLVWARGSGQQAVQQFLSLVFASFTRKQHGAGGREKLSLGVIFLLLRSHPKHQ